MISPVCWWHRSSHPVLAPTQPPPLQTTFNSLSSSPLSFINSCLIDFQKCITQCHHKERSAAWNEILQLTLWEKVRQRKCSQNPSWNAAGVAFTFTPAKRRGLSSQMLDSVWDRVKQQHADWIQKKNRFRLWDKNMDEYCKGYFNDKKQSPPAVAISTRL